MHNRDMIWKTSDGRSLKLRDITSRHLSNILTHIDRNIDAFNHKFGVARMEECKNNITQEIRLRKLNRLESSTNEEELF